MSALRPGARCVVTEGWARGRHGVVTHTVTQDGHTFASVHLDGDLFATVGADDLVPEASRPESEAPTDAIQRDADVLHHSPPAAA